MDSALLHSVSPFSRHQSLRPIASSIFAVAASVYAAPSAAHAKWFTDDKGILEVAAYALSEGAVQVWIAVLVAVLAAVLLLERRQVMTAPAWLHLYTAPYAGHLRRLAQLTLGISLFVLAIRGCMLAPCRSGTPPEVFWLLLFAQAGTGCMLIADEVPRVAVTVTAALAVAVGAYSGPASSLEASHVLALAAYFALASDLRYRNRALWLLRFGLGISFSMAAFSEKLLDPALGTQFLARIDLNFMKHLGFDYSDRLFILSAGMSELLLGLLLVAGLATRMTACALTAFLLASNAYLLLIGLHDDALTELVGHAPILAALLVVALYGKGEWRLHETGSAEFDGSELAPTQALPIRRATETSKTS